MIEENGINWIHVVFLWNGERICSFKCENYGEMIKFLHFCKKYEVGMWPSDVNKTISEEMWNKIEGIPGYVKDYYFEYGGDDCLQAIKVEIGI